MQGKICLIGERLAKGGAERVMAELSQTLSQLGYEVHLVIVVDDIQYAYQGQLLNLGQYKNSSNGPLNKMKRMRILHQYLRQHRMDAIIDFRIRIRFMQEILTRKYVYNAPTFYTVHSSHLPWYMPQNPLLANWVYAEPARLIAVSAGIVQAIQARYPKLQPWLLYNGVRTADFAPATDFKPTEPPYIFMAGRMDNANKQFDHAMQAFAKAGLAAHGWQLRIAGQGTLLSRYQQLAQDLGIHSSVQFLGHRTDMASLFQQAQVTVLCSQYEGFPRILIESLASGTPIISYDCPTGPREIVQNDVNGVLVENQNQTQLAEVFTTLHTQPQRWQAYAAQAIPSARRWDWEEIGPNWVRILKNV